MITPWYRLIRLARKVLMDIDVGGEVLKLVNDGDNPLVIEHGSTIGMTCPLADQS